MNHLDLFSGIGCFSLGLQQAGIEPNWIGYSDIDKYANKVFKRRFPNAKELGSITNLQPKDLPEIDLITFGFPCQDLSIAGKRGGLKANRSSLFFEAIKIIRNKKPKYFIFENVKGIFSSNKGQDFDIILRSIADIGYDGEWQLCNTRWFLPQNRERIYFIGHIRGQPKPKVFPIGETSKIINNRKTKICNTLQHPGHSGGNYKGMTMIQERFKVHTTQPRSGDPNKGGTGLLSREDGNTYCLDTGNSQAVEEMNCLTEATGNRAGSSSEFINESAGTTLIPIISGVI